MARTVERGVGRLFSGIHIERPLMVEIVNLPLLREGAILINELGLPPASFGCRRGLTHSAMCGYSRTTSLKVRILCPCTSFRMGGNYCPKEFQRLFGAMS